jgi:hypothetical protein
MTAIECSKNCLQTYQRGSLFRHADRFGKIPSIGSAIGAIRTTGSILGMFGAGFVYGVAYFFKNETLKEKCLFAHERAIDETIRGIYEIFAYGVFCEKLVRVGLSKIFPKISAVEKSHNYFAHGSVFTVDANRRIRYYSRKEIPQLNQMVKALETPTIQQQSMPNDAAKKTTHLVHLEKTSEERRKFIAALIKDLNDGRPKPEYDSANYPNMDTTIYF